MKSFSSSWNASLVCLLKLKADSSSRNISPLGPVGSQIFNFLVERLQKLLEWHFHRSPRKWKNLQKANIDGRNTDLKNYPLDEIATGMNMVAPTNLFIISPHNKVAPVNKTFIVMILIEFNQMIKCNWILSFTGARRQTSGSEARLLNKSVRLSECLDKWKRSIKDEEKPLIGVREIMLISL